MGRSRASGALALVAVLAGCGSSSHQAAPVTGDYVGKAGGRATAVAVVVGKANVVAYVCDWRRHVAELFTGSRSGERLALRGARGGKLSGIVAPNRVSGTFTVKGKTVRFVAAVAKRPAGFYRARASVHGKTATAGWVVFSDGSQRGAVTIGTTIGPAPALTTSTSTATLSGTRLTAVRISSGSISQTGQLGQIGQIGGG
jgi:hypothetical protein